MVAFLISMGSGPLFISKSIASSFFRVGMGPDPQSPAGSDPGEVLNSHIDHVDISTFGLRLNTYLLLDFSLTVKAAPHECVIRTSQP